MKTYINKISRLNYSNEVIGANIGFSSSIIHKHRKNFNPNIDRLIGQKFFGEGYTIEVMKKEDISFFKRLFNVIINILKKPIDFVKKTF